MAQDDMPKSQDDQEEASPDQSRIKIKKLEVNQDTAQPTTDSELGNVRGGTPRDRGIICLYCQGRTE